jgi:hypothetical protein
MFVQSHAHCKARPSRQEWPGELKTLCLQMFQLHGAYGQRPTPASNAHTSCCLPAACCKHTAPALQANCNPVLTTHSQGTPCLPSLVSKAPSLACLGVLVWLNMARPAHSTASTSAGWSWTSQSNTEAGGSCCNSSMQHVGTSCAYSTFDHVAAATALA